MDTIVIALGGNALGNTPEEQIKLVKKTAKIIAELASKGYKIAVGHGNGPQVGIINSAFEASAAADTAPAMPFPECDAMSQGYIGYHLQQMIRNELDHLAVRRNCVSVITQVIVDQKDQAFEKPTKPIGKFMSQQEATAISQKSGHQFIEDAGRGYRRVVPSPLPKEIVEIETIKQLIQEGTVVITVGGGGIPVIKTTEGYEGIAAVIDKDRSCANLAIELAADRLLILTSVEKIYLNFNTPEQKPLDRVTVSEMKKYMQEGHFAEGSMLPKVEAALTFVEATSGKAIITSLEEAETALDEQTGTIIIRD